MKYLIIIPARGGSKRLKNKNILPINNIPLIGHTINFIKNLNLFDKNDIWVNTDCDKIEIISKAFIKNIYRRPQILGGDKVSTAAVVKEQVENFMKKGLTYDAVIILQPTNPFRTKKLILDSIFHFEKNSSLSLASFSLLKKKIGRIKLNKFSPINYVFGERSQDIDSIFFENGLIYITKTEYILKNIIISEDVYPLVYNHVFSQIDIDTEEDFLKATEIYYKYKDLINV